jgi:hypothetical protein
MLLTTWIWSSGATLEFPFFTLDKSRESELQSEISYTASEEKMRKKNSALKVDQHVN